MTVKVLFVLMWEVTNKLYKVGEFANISERHVYNRPVKENDIMSIYQRRKMRHSTFK